MKLVPVGLLALAAAGAAYAHHSAAMFDPSKTVVLDGVIKQFQWTNPHSWLIVEVQSGGKTQEWSVEMTSPNLLARAGWRPGTIKPGEKIRVVGAPLRDGNPGAQFKCAVLADGRVLTYQSVAPAANGVAPAADAKPAPEQACGAGLHK